MSKAVALVQPLECGTIERDSNIPYALVFRCLQEDVPVEMREAAALVFPGGQSPFPLLLARCTAHRPLYLADQEAPALRWQRCHLGEEVMEYHHVDGVATLPATLRDLGLVLNPFGLQHWPSEVPLYASLVRERCRRGAVLLTLDWGTIDYPQEIATLPGIAGEIRFNEQSLLPPYGPETGWQLRQERTIRYGEEYTILDLFASRPGQAMPPPGVSERKERFVVRSSWIYRLYVAQ
jgi:hypothetical protein